MGPVCRHKAGLHLILDSEINPWRGHLGSWMELRTQDIACNLNSLKKIDGLKGKKMPEHLFNPAKNRIQKVTHARKTISTHTKVTKISNCKKRLFRSTASKTTIHVIPQTNGQRLRWASYIKKIDEYQAKRASQRNSDQQRDLYGPWG